MFKNQFAPEIRWASLFTLILLLLSNLLTNESSGQNRPQKTSVNASRPERRFDITPLVNNLSLRAGQTARVEFTLTSNGLSRYVVQPVNMQQLPSGLLLPVEDKTPRNIRLISKPKITVDAGQQSIIKVEVKAPARNGLFLPLGVLVTQLPDKNLTLATGDEKRAGVTYISRYLLRVEVRTPGATNGQQALKIAGAGVMSQKGMPVLRAVVASEAMGAVEFSVNAQLLQDGQRTGRPFKLAMPVRASEKSARKYAAKVLPKTKIYMESPLPGPIISGDYELELSIAWQGRRYGVTRGKVHLEAEDFPALEGRHTVLLNQLHILNPQISFGASAGSKRLTALRLENRGKSAVKVDLKLPAGSWCYARPSQITIPPSSTRGVLIGLKGRQPEQPTYQSLEITASTGEEDQLRIDEKVLPIAWVPADAEATPLSTAKLEWNAMSKRLQMKVTNTGKRHQTPQVRMRLVSAKGHQAELYAGFGAWVLPGATRTLSFALHKLPPGAYHYDGEIESAGNVQRLRGEVRILP